MTHGWIARALIGICLTAASPALADTIYWTDFGDNGTGGISRADTDTLEIETVIPDGLSTPYRIAIDPLGGKMYWTGYAFGGGVQRANLDGSEVESIVWTCMAMGIAVDGAGGKLYWNTSGDVWRANLDGSGIELLFSADEPGFIQDLALDLLNQKIYFSNWSALPGSYGRLQRANLDGSDIEDVRPEIRNGPIGIAVERNPSAENTDLNWSGHEAEFQISAVDPSSEFKMRALDTVNIRIKIRIVIVKENIRCVPIINRSEVNSDIDHRVYKSFKLDRPAGARTEQIVEAVDAVK